MRDPASKTELVVPEEHTWVWSLVSMLVWTQTYTKQILFSKCLGIIYLTQAPTKECLPPVRAFLNMEICSWPESVKYTFKYIVRMGHCKAIIWLHYFLIKALFHLTEVMFKCGWHRVIKINRNLKIIQWYSHHRTHHLQEDWSKMQRKFLSFRVLYDYGHLYQII